MHSFSDDSTAWDGEGITRPGSPEATEWRNGRVGVGRGEAWVGVQQIPDRGWWGKVELNPSRVLDPNGVSLCEVNDLDDVLAAAWGEATAELLEPACELEDARVKRLDVACDFGSIERPEYFIRGLLPVRRKWARHQYLYNDPARNRAETLCVGSSSSRVRLYGKESEALNSRPRAPGEDDEVAERRFAAELVAWERKCEAAAGVVRWEVEARGEKDGWLQRIGGIKTVVDVTVRNCERLIEDRWDWSGMGAEVATSTEVVERVLAAGLTPTVEDRLLGWMLKTAKGVHSERSRNTSSKYARLCSELGITLTPDVFDEDVGEAPARALDLELGSERVAA